MKKRITPAVAVTALAAAVIFGTGGAVTAAAMIDGNRISKGSISANRLTDAARESLRGRTGEQGEQGVAGPAGPAGPKGDAGAPGPAGVKGDTGAAGTNGTNGWQPVMSVSNVDGHSYLRLTDWTGGTGTKPTVPTNNYVGTAGLTNLAGATDIRGAQGAAGSGGGATTPVYTFVQAGPSAGFARAECAGDSIAVGGGGSSQAAFPLGEAQPLTLNEPSMFGLDGRPTAWQAGGIGNYPVKAWAVCVDLTP